MTRNEYLIKEVQNKTSKIIDILNNRKDKKGVEYLNFKGFLYTVGRLDPLTYLMILTRALTDEEFKQLEEQLNKEQEA